MLTVYLSGGMKSDWQDTVKSSIYNAEWIDPSRHGLSKPDEYTAWDLLGVRKADIVFAYLAEDNPSGIGLALEVGYAKALGKTIVFVDERGGYTDIVRSTADVWCDNLDEGIGILRMFVQCRGKQDASRRL
jgi:nucleoside 2-deoxyribosyltransferase